jgi:uncharacterized repeat protein (TIGR01451 family)
MTERTLTRLTLGTALIVLALIASPFALALGTPAGTPITNQATVTFEDVNGNSLSDTSNPVTTIVSAVGGVSILPTTAAQNADPGDLACYLHTVSNDGNETDTIDIDLTSVPNWTVNVYEDSDSDGVYTAGTDTPLADTTGDGSVDTGPLVEDTSMEILVCVSVPAGTANGTTHQTDVDVTSDFDPTQTDQAVDTTTVDAPDLSVVKAVAPAGNQPPGTTLTYTVTITNNGDGAVQNLVLTDPIPNFTTYVATSITQDGNPRTDGADGDNADYNVTNPGEITVAVGTLDASGGVNDSTVITFQVTID